MEYRDDRGGWHPQLLDLIKAAEDLLALTGQAVELCPNYGEPTR